MKSSLLDGVHHGYVIWSPEAGVPTLKHAGEEWAFPEYATTFHAHPHHELHLQLSGSTEWEADGETIVVEKGMLVAMAPDVRHRMRPRSARVHHFIYFSCDLPALMAQCGLDGGLPMFQRPWFLIRNAEELIPPFTTLSREIRYPRPARRVMIDLATRMIGTMLHRIAAEEVAEAAEAAGVEDEASVREPIFSSYLLHRVRGYIESHLTEKLSIAEMTSALGISRSTLFDAVRRELGKSPAAYHAERRIELAKTMLQTPALPLTQIAIELGFSSSQHFSSAFRKQTGQSPSAYRATFHTQPTPT